MLAYVFWHWRRPEVDRAAYVALQRAFHAALAAAPTPGYHRSFSVELAGAPWAADGGEAYEDWYLVDDFAAFDALHEAAVTASRAGPHDAAAAVAAGGVGGVYRVRRGTPAEAPRHAAWFAKPAGMSYEELAKTLAPVIEESGGVLWLRQLVLGPAREFCLHSAEPVALPAPFAPLDFPLQPMWPPLRPVVPA